MYGKYFYSHLGSNDATLSTGEDYHFDGVNSHRLRIGVRYTNKYNQTSTMYYGVAYEYEIVGSAETIYKGMNTLSPSLKGSS